MSCMPPMRQAAHYDVDSPEDIQRCLNCTRPVAYCKGDPQRCVGLPKKRGPYMKWTPEMVDDVVAGRKTQCQLAKEMGITQATVSGAMKRLRERGEI